MELIDLLRLVHPALAVTMVVPFIGIVTYFAWQTRQRRLETLQGEKSRIPSSTGQDHMRLGRILTNAVVAICLIAFLHPIIKTLIKKQVWASDPLHVVFIALIFGLTLASLVFLNRAKPEQPFWRVGFTLLTVSGVMVLGWEDGVFHRDDEWYLSHFYSGVAVTTLMILSMAMLPEIYQDRTHRWRKLHIILNSIAVVLFVVQGMTGVRDLLEIPLSWQETHLGKCNYSEKTCLSQTPLIPGAVGESPIL